eukprot:4036828-Amphidinium_carterae.1
MQGIGSLDLSNLAFTFSVDGGAIDTGKHGTATENAYLDQKAHYGGPWDECIGTQSLECHPDSGHGLCATVRVSWGPLSALDTHPGKHQPQNLCSFPLLHSGANSKARAK